MDHPQETNGNHRFGEDVLFLPMVFGNLHYGHEAFVILDVNSLEIAEPFPLASEVSGNEAQLGWMLSHLKEEPCFEPRAIPDIKKKHLRSKVVTFRYYTSKTRPLQPTLEIPWFGNSLTPPKLT